MISYTPQGIMLPGDKMKGMKIKSYKKFYLYMIIFLLIYTVIDFLNMSYSTMIDVYGLGLVGINIMLNLGLSFLSALLLFNSEELLEKQRPFLNSENVSYLTLLFALLTYGCTPCVIAFFASLGLSFSVLVLPLAGLPYKLIALSLLVLGFLWSTHELKKQGCQIRRTEL